MTFVRRSRKGRIHVVRERVAGGYKRLAKGLARANNNVMGGVWQAHKGLQLGLAKGHQSIQSGLKTVQDITGDFNMYQSNSYYQYQPPVAMFSMAEVDKYNQYSDNGMAYFAKTQRALPGSGQSSGSGVRGVYGKVKYGAKNFAGKVGDTIADKSYGAYRAVGNKPGGDVFRKVGYYAMKNPGKAGAIALGLGALGTTAAGVGGSMFMRRRRSKTGKVIVEQVRR